MRQIYKLLIFLNFATSVLAMSDETPSRSTIRSLATCDRPLELRHEIDLAFNNIGNVSWRYFGGTTYGLAHINEAVLLRSLIRSDYHNKEKRKKTYYFLDIGAGNFRLGRHICEEINKDTDIPLDTTVHLIGIRGELYEEEEIIHDGKCIRYELGNFKIEDIKNEFSKRGLDFVGKIDFIVSALTFRHLVDPLGTLLEAYSFLNEDCGILALDGFFVKLENEHELSNYGLLQLFSKISNHVAMYNSSSTCFPFFSFVLIRDDQDKPKLYLDYTGKTVRRTNNCGSEKVTEFRWCEGETIGDLYFRNGQKFPKESHFQGDEWVVVVLEELCDWENMPNLHGESYKPVCIPCFFK